MNGLPSQVRVLVIGGGAVGCSALYHLAKRGWTDSLLVEMDELTSGSTWHAAGLTPNFSSSWGIMKLQRYSTKLYADLGREADYPINYHVTGSIRLAHTNERMAEYHHVVSMAHHQGIEFDLLSTNQIKDKYPMMDLHDLKGALWDPHDGDIDPAQLTQAFAKGARNLGAKVVRGCRVTGLRQNADGTWRVETNLGATKADIVVNAAGYRAPEIGAMVGRDVPSVTMSHQYLVTESIKDLEGRPDRIPLVRDPDDSYYLRQEAAGLLLGPYEWKATAKWLDGTPKNFAFGLFDDDLDRLQDYIEKAIERVPVLGTAGIKRVINGPMPYTPDGNPLIGPAPGLTNFYECCVFSFGIVQAGGAGKTIADWVIDGSPEWDLWSLDPRRYTGFVTKRYVEAKAIELYQNEYAVSFPFEERAAGRPARTSALYPILKSKGALFGARNGWERAIWFPQTADEASTQLRYTLGRPAFTKAIGRECTAVTKSVGIGELPGFSRFDLTGKDSAAWLDGLIAGALPKVGRVSLSYVLNKNGGVLSEMTVTRLAEDHFMLLTASTAEWHDQDLLRRRLPDKSLTLKNVTAQASTLIVAGPRSRDVLLKVIDVSLTSHDFPWLSWQKAHIGAIPVLALRINYIGELGWELHVPMENLVPVYELISSAGEEFEICDFGIYAIDSMRLEKCYRGWKQDLTTEYSALQAGLDRFIRFNKPDFPGKSALLKERTQGISDKFVPLLVDADGADALYASTVFKNGKRVGFATSGGYGHRIGRSIALAYVRSDLAQPNQELQIDILGKLRGAIVGTEPLFDPNNDRLRL